MDDTSAQRIRAGLSFLFAPGERPDAGALRSALEACQASARIMHEDAGAVEVVAGGLTFEIDGLSPAGPLAAGTPADHYGFSQDPNFAGLEAVRLFPGPHLSGGTALPPVYQAMLALAAELAVSLPARAIHWHPADTAIEPRAFSRSTLGWLAGGAFPALGLVALKTLSDGSVVSRGLAHFVGQEVTVRGPAGEATLKTAERVVDRLVRTGPLKSFTQFTIEGEVLCAEPSQRAKQVLVWPAE